MAVSKQLQADLSSDDIIRNNQARSDTRAKKKPPAAKERGRAGRQVGQGESLCELGRRKKVAPRDAGHS